MANICIPPPNSGICEDLSNVRDISPLPIVEEIVFDTIPEMEIAPDTIQDIEPETIRRIPAAPDTIPVPYSSHNVNHKTINVSCAWEQ